MFGWIITGVISLPFIIMAIFLLSGKGSFLIAGFNTMSNEQKAVYDEKALCKAVGTLLLVLAGLMFLFPLAMQFETMWLFWVAFALFMAVTIGFAIYANTGNRFRIIVDANVSQTPSTSRAKMTKGTKIALIIGIIISAQILIGIGVMFYFGEKDPVVVIQTDSIKIDAMYGITVNKSEIIEIKLIERNMHDIGIGRRTNGYDGFGQVLKGNFSSAELGIQLLFVCADSAPTIQIIRTIGADIFISFRDGETTKYTYNELSSALS